MPERQFPIHLVVRGLDDDVLVAEPLLFPEISCCDRNGDRLRITVRELARRIVESQENFTLHQRALAGELTAQTVAVTLDPPRKKPDWAQPVELQFHVVRWRHASEAHLAFVPALGIEVAAAREADLLRMLPQHILAALRRQKISESLYELALIQRTESADTTNVIVTASIKSPRQIEQDEGKEKAEKPAIEQVGVDRAREVVIDHLDELQKEMEDFKPPEALTTARRQWISTLEVDVRLEPQFEPVKENFFAQLGAAEKMSGRNELHKVGRCLEALYPDELDRAVLREAEVKELEKLLAEKDGAEKRLAPFAAAPYLRHVLRRAMGRTCPCDHRRSNQPQARALLR
jgi:hypothetical protein